MENTTVPHSERPRHDARRRVEVRLFWKLSLWHLKMFQNKKNWGSCNMKSVATSIPTQLHNFQLVFDYICHMFLKL